MKILVTGGAGFIGSHVVDALVARKHRVTVLDNLSTGKRTNLNPQAGFIKMDVASPLVGSATKRLKPEIIFHFAAQKDPRLSVLDPVADAKTNVIGLLRLVKAGLECRIRKFILASTGGAIYGGANKIPTPETYPAHPLSPYGVSKLASEHYLHSYRHAGGFPSVSLRLANVYGPRQDPKSEAGAIAIWLGRMARGQRPVIFGDGRQTRDFVYVDDVVRAFLSAMSKPATGVINVGTSKETDLNTLCGKVARAFGSTQRPVYAPSKIGEEHRSAVAIRLAREELGWKPTTVLDDGLRRTVRWFHEQHKIKR